MVDRFLVRPGFGPVMLSPLMLVVPNTIAVVHRCRCGYPVHMSGGVALNYLKPPLAESLSDFRYLPRPFESL